MVRTNHAVLSDGVLYTGNELTRVSDGALTLGALSELAYPRFVSHLWVMPEMGEIAPAKADGDWQFSIYSNRKHAMMGAVVRKRGHREKDLDIIFPGATSWWGTTSAPGWMRQARPLELLTTIHYLEQSLGVPVSGSPGRTGWNYLKLLHPEWIEEIPDFDLAAHHFDKRAAADIIWERPLHDYECGDGWYIHKFDKGGAYPYASSQTDIGVGVPVYKGHGDDAVHERGHPQEVGVWRCSIYYDASVYNDRLPPLWREDRHLARVDECWLSGPIIRLLRSQGHRVDVHEGWVFPARHDVMVKWAKGLWDIRQGFMLPRWEDRRCAMFARDATKQIANMTIGITAFRDFDDDDEMRRPDIRMQVIARHRELTWHNINKMYTFYRIEPVIVYMDALYYIAWEPNGRVFIPELVKREGQLGGYRWEGRVRLDADVIAMFAESMGEADRLEYLNKKGWQQ